jgi:hypothetical protein
MLGEADIETRAPAAHDCRTELIAGSACTTFVAFSCHPVAQKWEASLTCGCAAQRYPRCANSQAAQAACIRDCTWHAASYIHKANASLHRHQPIVLRSSWVAAARLKPAAKTGAMAHRQCDTTCMASGNVDRASLRPQAAGRAVPAAPGRHGCSEVQCLSPSAAATSSWRGCCSNAPTSCDRHNWCPCGLITAAASIAGTYTNRGLSIWLLEQSEALSLRF